METNEHLSPSPPASAGALLGLIRDDVAVTRADLARATGLARSTVAQRVEALLRQDLVYEAGGSTSTGGRPPTVLAFNHGAGVVLVADLGATHARVAVSDLRGAPLAERASDLDIALGPEKVLEWVSTASRSCSRRSAAPRPTYGGSASGCPGRSSSTAVGRSTRRSCPAGTTSPSPPGSRAGTARRCWWTTT